ncbi:MAG: NAD-dependent epimerase/dehydratase family protein [Puniceicoccaceae bacterium]|nr:NAD-dependent epimerase/dehydratase family protein [Puniceicoccaceae bacterium]
MSQKHYLITGGGGFIGSHLTKRILKEGHQATVTNISHGIRFSCPQSLPRPQPEI